LTCGAVAGSTHRKPSLPLLDASPAAAVISSFSLLSAWWPCHSAGTPPLLGVRRMSALTPRLLLLVSYVSLGPCSLPC